MIIRTPSATYPAVMWAADPPAAAPPPAKEEAPPAGEPPAGDPPADKKPDGSFLANADDDKIDETVKVVAPADWPEDWRDKLAGGDAAARKRLDRFKAPGDIFKSYTELESKFKSGKPVDDEPMPDAEAEPEKAKEWRKARGIPEDPTGYAVPETVKNLVTDADKPRLTAFTEAMHAKGIPTSAAGAVMEWYFQEQDAIASAIAENDKEHSEKLQEELRSEWGSDFRANSTLAKRYAEKVFGDVPWTEARLPDGRRMGDIPEMVRALADAGRSEFGDVSFASGDAANKTMARKQELEIMMAEDRPKYMANPAFAKEYEAIIDAELKAGQARGSHHSPKPQ
jgi:hypothetical protein